MSCIRFHRGSTYISKRAMAALEDEFAENLARDHWSINQIADRMDVTRGTGCVLYCRVCARLGETVQ